MTDCSICNRRVLQHCHKLKCSLCQNSCHLRCLPLIAVTDPLYTDRETNKWMCITCSSENFPFNHILDNNYFLETLSENWLNTQHAISYSKLEQYIFNPFQWNDENPNLPNFDTDPDIQFFNEMTCLTSNTRCNYYLEDSFNQMVDNKVSSGQCFSVAHINIRSIPKNFQDWNIYLSTLQYEFTVIGISETWLSDFNVDYYNQTGYKHMFQCRSNGKRGGGVSLFIQNGVDISKRDELCYNEGFLECLFVELSTPNTGLTTHTIVGIIYRPPNSDMQCFNEKLLEILSLLKRENKSIYLMGDFNINLLETDNHLPSAEFIENMYSFGLFPLINKPTRVRNDTATLIDNIFSNNIDGNRTNGILYVDVSDHFPIFSIDHFTNFDKKISIYWKRNYSLQNMEAFSKKLKDNDWDCVYESQDGHEAFEAFLSRYRLLYDTCFPLKMVKSNYLTKKHWLTEAMKKSIQYKNKLYKHSLKVNTNMQTHEYKKYKSALKKVLKAAERQHLEDLIKENRSNSRKLWIILKRIINKTKCGNMPSTFRIGNENESDKGKIANGFNNYFVNIGKDLAKKIPITDINPLDYIKSTNTQSIMVDPVDQSEVKRILLSFKNTSPGWDGIHPKVLKQTSELCMNVITYVMNLSITTGFFPNSLKLAKVVPLFKNGDNKQISNYRPVSILPAFSKLLEKLMYNRLLSFIKKHDILYKFQFGFREHHSTSMALIILIDKIMAAIDSGEIVVGVFLDFRKAFDTIDHQILMNKLYKYGIRGVVYDWVSDYL